MITPCVNRWSPLMTPYPVAQVEIHGTQKAGKEKPSLGGDIEQVARVAKLSREA